MASGDIEVNITADTSQLSAGLKSAEQQMSSMQSRMSSTAKASRKMAERNLAVMKAESANAAAAAGKASGRNFAGAFARVGVAAVITQAIDSGLRGALSKFKETGSMTGTEFAIAVGDGFTSTLSSLPIVGPVGDLFGMALDKITGGYMERERDAANRLNSAQQQLLKSATRRVHQEKLIADEIERQAKAVNDAQLAATAANAKVRGQGNDRGMSQAFSRFGSGDQDTSEGVNKAAQKLYRQIEETEEFATAQAEERLKLELERIEALTGLGAQGGDKEAMRIAAKSQLETEMAQIRFQRQDNERKASDMHGQKLDAIKNAEEVAARQVEVEEKANQKIADKRAALLKKESLERFKMERELNNELDAARLQAAQAVAGLTGSAGTAGGSFTFAVQGKVNEAKILNQLSQQSRDLLAQIVQNTMGGMGFA